MAVIVYVANLLLPVSPSKIDAIPAEALFVTPCFTVIDDTVLKDSAVVTVLPAAPPWIVTVWLFEEASVPTMTYLAPELPLDSSVAFVIYKHPPLQRRK